MQWLLKWTDRLTSALRAVGLCCLMGMTLLTCVDVVGRKFGHPVPGSVELVGFMATLAVAAALPYTHQAKAHIGVEILVRLLPEKTQAVIDLCTCIAALALFAVVTWQMALYAHTIQQSGTVSMSLGLPEHWLIYCTAAGFLVFTLSLVVDIIALVVRMKGRP